MQDQQYCTSSPLLLVQRYCPAVPCTATVSTGMVVVSVGKRGHRLGVTQAGVLTVAAAVALAGAAPPLHVTHRSRSHSRPPAENGVVQVVDHVGLVHLVQSLLLRVRQSAASRRERPGSAAGGWAHLLLVAVVVVGVSPRGGRSLRRLFTKTVTGSVLLLLLKTGRAATRLHAL